MKVSQMPIDEKTNPNNWYRNNKTKVLSINTLSDTTKMRSNK